MNTAEFAQELNTTPRVARKFLRSITPKDDQPGKGSRWDLPSTKREVTKLKKQFDSWKAAQEKANDEDADSTDEETDAEVTDEV